ncbi:FAD-binding oxidoreductase [Paracoccaceae bacterium]|nr:FAD-binding oxidoreductase [Paracoccaceae bacterium]
MRSKTSVLNSSLSGDLLDGKFDRGRYSTDASIYQIMPEAIVLPKTLEDIQKTIQFSLENNIPILPRGGGTSQNGQTVNQAIVLDNSRYLNKIIEIDEENLTCVVEPGVVLDELNRQLKPFDLWFPVDVSTSSRATIGGMAGNNSAGGRSIRYGIMRDNILSINTILSDGSKAHFGLAKKSLSGLEKVFPKLIKIAERNQKEIKTRYPKVLRRVGGYNLDALLPDTLASRPGSIGNENDINLSHLIVGSEGTLAYSTSIELKLSPLPPPKIMALCHFSTFYEAMDSAQHIVKLDPIAVELIDSTMISLGRSIPIFSKTIDDFVVNDPKALLVVEFAEDIWSGNLKKVRDLEVLLKDTSDNTINSIVVIKDEKSQNRISEMRKSGLNIMMSMKSEAKPVSFVEDCAVPLHNLAEYTQGLTDIFDKYQTSGTWYAHASVGCLHVRPVLNMKDSRDIIKMRAIATEAFELVKKFNGSHSGEHGDGISRSEFNPVMFGKKLTNAFREIKSLMDPHGIFNPGKIVDAPKMDDRHLFRFSPGYSVSGFHTELDWSSWPGSANGFQGAVEMCNNNGACRKLEGGVMCPSFRITGEEKDSTRGRANSLRLAMSGQLGPNAMASAEMLETMKLCVSCKACKRECPTSVDMSAMKLEVMALNAKYNSLSIQERLIAYLPDYAPLASSFNKILNLRNSSKNLAKISERLTGFSAQRNLPVWRTDWFRDHEVSADPVEQYPVILFVDTFNRYFEPENLRSAVRVLRNAGYQPFYPKPEEKSRKALCCGKTHLSVGNISKAKEAAERLVKTYLPYAKRGLPIVGLEPSCLFALKDEIPSLLKTNDAKLVAENVITFEELLSKDKKFLKLKPLKAKALLHGHCHQKAFNVLKSVENVLHFIQELEVEKIETSCCGMAGAFGYSKETMDLSIKMAEKDLLPKIRQEEDGTILIADGTSCRSQIVYGTKREAIHVACLLDQQLIDN